MQRSPSDRHRIGPVGLVAMPSGIHPHPSSQLRRHIHHRLTRGDQPLRDAAPDSVCSLDRPHPGGELRHRVEHGNHALSRVIEPIPHM